MTPVDVVVTGLGLHTSMGGVVQAAAGHRAGLNRAQEIIERPYYSEETREVEPITGHPSHGVSEGFQGRGRLLRLARNAFADLWLSVERDELKGERCGIIVVGPRARDDTRSWLQLDEQKQEFSGHVARLAGIHTPPLDNVPYLEGKIGTASAIAGAVTQVASGAWEQAVVVALDSLLESETLLSLMARGKVKTDSNPHGLMPGEAACVMLLEAPATAQESGRESLARAGVPSALPGTPDAAQGEGLARVLFDLVSRGSGAEQTGTLYSDVSGSPNQAVELATALVRLQGRTKLATWKHELPALSFGDTGVAAGLLSAALAVRAFDRGYASGELAAVALSDDDSSHVAWLLEKP